MENTNKVVNDVEPTIQPESHPVDPRALPDIEPEEPEVIPEEAPAAPEAPIKAGDKTPPNALLASLQEERDKRRAAEAELAELKNSPALDDVFSDEGKLLKGHIQKVEAQLASYQKKDIDRDLQTKFPQLKDKFAEFETFRQDYPAGNDEAVAKIFLAENDLLGTPPPRKGLEKAVGGGRQTPQQGMTSDEIEHLMKTNFRKYSQMLKDGLIK